MRTATGLDETEWEIFVEWEGRKPMHTAFRRFRRQREAQAQKRSEDRRGSVLDGCDPLSGIGDELGVIVIVAIVVALMVAFGPSVFAVVFGIIELGVILLAITLGFVGRTLLRRPWRVAAVSDTGVVWAWRQVGFLKARRLVHEIADGLDAGQAPLHLASDRLESTTPYEIEPDAYLGLVAKPWFRLAAVAVVLISLALSIGLLIERLS